MNALPTMGAKSSTAATHWRVESIRFTAFLPQGFEVVPADWWAKVVGARPEKRVEKPLEARLLEEGKDELGRLRLTYEPRRVDWILTGQMGEALERTDVSVLADFEAAMGHFIAVPRGWLELGIPVVRLALGANLLFQVDDLASAHSALLKYLPDVSLDGDFRDFEYQINRYRKSKCIEGLETNRLCKWSAAQLRSFSANIAISQQSEGQPVPIPTTSVGPVLTACRLELDMNSSADWTSQIVGRSAQELLRELVDCAIEVAREGDRP